MTADGDQLDAAVAALAGRFRGALDEPRHAGVDLDAAGVRALVDEPLPSTARRSRRSSTSSSNARLRASSAPPGAATSVM